LEKLQYKAGLTITGGIQGTSYLKVMNELSWSSLSERRLELVSQGLELEKHITMSFPSHRREVLIFMTWNPSYFDVHSGLP
jgi:hypothetical protein